MTVDAHAAVLTRVLDEAGVAAAVVLTNNRARIVSARRRNGLPEVRVARTLLARGDAAVIAIRDWAVDPRGGRRCLQALVSDLEPAATPRRRVRLDPVGEVHDLRAIEALERARAFPELPVVPITWGKRQHRRRPQRSIRLGSYDFRRGVIRIHRRLDDVRVPSWFVGFVVHHELIHRVIGHRTEPCGRVHGPRFQAMESLHPRWAEAQRWEARQLPLLLAGG